LMLRVVRVPMIRRLSETDILRLGSGFIFGGRMRVFSQRFNQVRELLFVHVIEGLIARLRVSQIVTR
jgi:hypothetical protein